MKIINKMVDFGILRDPAILSKYMRIIFDEVGDISPYEKILLGGSLKRHEMALTKQVKKDMIKIIGG